jgi:hypothetical protein
MASTETVPGLSQEAKDLWVRSYQGEILGEAYFGQAASQVDDVEQRAKLEVLTTLERCTKELLAPSLRRLGISTDADPAILEQAANGARAIDYDALVRALPAITGQYLGLYARLRQLVDPVDASVVDQLIAHEMALELFARRELAGERAQSLEPIRALSHVTL